MQALAGFLADPSVGIALDPEWKLAPGQYAIQDIGAAYAASINAVSSYLSALIERDELPDKLLVIHQFLPSMLPDRQNIRPAPGLEMVFHADGVGGPDGKIRVYHQVALPGPPFHTGIKFSTPATAT